MHRYLIATGLAVLALVAIAGTPFALTPPSPVPAERPDALAQSETAPATEPPAAAPSVPAPTPAVPTPQPAVGAEPPPLEEEVVQEVWPMPVEDFLAGKFLERADVVLTRREWDVASWAIRWATNSPFSHSAMVFTGPQFESGYTSTFVIEAGTGGVDLTNLRDYIADKSAFIAIKRFRKEWFDEMPAYLALWWVPAGTIPTLSEGRARLELIGRLGPTQDAFDFKNVFAPPD